MMGEIAFARAKRWPTRSIAERLDEMSIPEPNTGCILWTGSVTPKGYGHIRINGELKSSHRVAYSLKFGPVGRATALCHKCDTPLCINPSHLFPGTLGQNNRDRHLKRRDGTAKGEKNGQAKLTEALVISIFMDPRSSSEVARMLGLGISTVWSIKTRKSWKHVTERLL